MTTETASKTATSSNVALALVDCDVHPHFADGVKSLEPYLPAAWRQRLLGVADEPAWMAKTYASKFTLPKNDLYINPGGVMRRDGSDDESIPGSQPPVVAKQLLDEYKIDRAILNCGNTLGLGALPNPDAAAAVASATNDWLTDLWLGDDDRFRGAIVVAPQDPVQAVAEIERVADREGFVQVHLPLTAILAGDRHYHPIYEAAEKHGLPVSLHPNSADIIYTKAPGIAGGTPTYYIEWHTAITQIFQSSVVSLVANGVFERFPALKVIITEGGFAWLPDVMWRMDANWKALLEEVPWLKRKPSEYIVDQIRFTTQPFVEPAKREHLTSICEIIEADRTLLFSSDYPHWDFDSPLSVLKELPDATRQRVAVENARELYGDKLI